MEDLTDALKAIFLLAIAVGLISFMFMLGTMLAPFAVVIFGSAIIYLMIKESKKAKRKKKKRNK